MLLNEIRNDQIYPYFWNFHKKKSGPFEASFVDLEKVRQRLETPRSQNSREMPDEIPDEIIEELLYGTPSKPRFSAWSLNVFERVSAECGFGHSRVVSNTDLLTTVQAESAAWGEKEFSRVARERRGQKIWSFRKSLRKKAAEARARARGLFRSPLKKSGELWLNLGAGEEFYDDYVKVDWSGDQDVFDNIVTLGKVARQSVARIYTNHVLEHIPPNLIPQMLKRWHEVLKPGGVLLARMPDAKQAVLCLNRPWREATEVDLVTRGFPNYLAREKDREGVLDPTSCIQTICGWSYSTPHSWDQSNQHKSLWTPSLARARFTEAGFKVEEATNLGSIQTVVVARRN